MKLFKQKSKRTLQVCGLITLLNLAFSNIASAELHSCQDVNDPKSGIMLDKVDGVGVVFTIDNANIGPGEHIGTRYLSNSKNHKVTDSLPALDSFTSLATVLNGINFPESLSMEFSEDECESNPKDSLAISCLGDASESITLLGENIEIQRAIFVDRVRVRTGHTTRAKNKEGAIIPSRESDQIHVTMLIKQKDPANKKNYTVRNIKFEYTCDSLPVSR